MVAKIRDMVSLSFVVFSRDIPSQVVLKEHSLGYVGRVASPGLVTGVYGAHSKQMALVLGAKWTKERASSTGLNRILMLDVNYRVDNYALTREQTRRDTLESTGWLHLDRVASGFRDEIKSAWIGWIKKETSAGVALPLEDQSLSDLALQYPRFIPKMFKVDPNIRGIVHPVNPDIDPSVVLWAATVRYEKERFNGPVMRYLPQSKVIL
jgi:hypothetical protein